MGAQLLPLPGIHQGPGRDAAIDDILSMVAGIVPAAADVERIGAAGPAIAVLVRSGNAGRPVRRMAGRPRPALAAGESRLDRGAGAVVIEIGKGVERQPRIEIGRDPEGAALRVADIQPIVVPRACKVAEIDQVKRFARGLVRADHDRAPLGAGDARCVEEAPRQRLQRRIRQQGTFGSIRQQAELVEADRAFRLGEVPGRRNGIESDHGPDEAACGARAEQTAVLVAAEWPPLARLRGIGEAVAGARGLDLQLQRRAGVGGQRLRRQQGPGGGIGRAGAPSELDDIAAGFAGDTDRVPVIVVLEGGEAGAVAVADRVEPDRGRGGRLFMLLPAGEHGGLPLSPSPPARLEGTRRRSAPARPRIARISQSGEPARRIPRECERAVGRDGRFGCCGRFGRACAWGWCRPGR